MTVKESAEMYLETILRLQEGGHTVRSVEIAEAMNFSKPSVSRAMKLLQEDGYISIDAHKIISLERKGKDIAEMIFERHQVITKFLNLIGVPKAIAEADACRMEHVVSRESFAKLKLEVARREKAKLAKKAEQQASKPAARKPAAKKAAPQKATAKAPAKKAAAKKPAAKAKKS